MKVDPSITPEEALRRSLRAEFQSLIDLWMDNCETQEEAWEKFLLARRVGNEGAVRSARKAVAEALFKQDVVDRMLMEAGGKVVAQKVTAWRCPNNVKVCAMNCGSYACGN